MGRGRVLLATLLALAAGIPIHEYGHMLAATALGGEAAIVHPFLTLVVLRGEEAPIPLSWAAAAVALAGPLAELAFYLLLKLALGDRLSLPPLLVSVGLSLCPLRAPLGGGKYFYTDGALALRALTGLEPRELTPPLALALALLLAAAVAAAWWRGD